MFRHLMPVAERYAYFDHAAVAPLPRATGLAMRQCLDEQIASGDLMWPRWAIALQRCRAAFSKLVNAHESEIALIPSTTIAINFIAEGIPWQPGDNVIVPANEFPSNLVAWRNLASRGVELRLVHPREHGTLEPSDIEPLIDHRTRLIAISYVGFTSGYRIDVQAMVELAHSRNVLLCLDAIQGLGAFPLDVRQSGVDFVCADGHKWMFGPEGAGMLYIRADRLDQLRPIGLGWGSLAAHGFNPKSTQLKATAARYEGGALNMIGFAGLAESLDLLLEYGAGACDKAGALQNGSRMAHAILGNVEQLADLLRSAGYEVHHPRAIEHLSGIIGVGWKSSDGNEVDEATYLAARKLLLERGVILSVRGGRLRVAIHGYNDSTDFERLIEGLNEFREG